MIDTKQQLHIISNETKKSISLMPIVTPSMYASVFSQFALEHDTDLSNEEQISRNIFQLEYSNLDALQKSTVKNANTLSHTASKALSAIKSKDESKLNEVIKETQQLRAELEKLKEALYKDELTNTYNRKWLHDTYLHEDGITLKGDGLLAIVDLNYFKIINDTHGHIVGDKVLIFIANQLKSKECRVVRYGGDEFILMIPQTISMQHANDALNAIREAVVSKRLKAHHNLFRASFSMGMSQYFEGDELSSIIAQADKKMYEDKLEIKKRITGIE